MDRKRILIVEDEEVVAEQIRHSLTARGYDVVGLASSGEQAIADGHRTRPDLVVMDVRLPGQTDGIAAAQELQSIGVPVIYLTAHADAHLLSRAQHTRPLAYVMKPAQAGELAAVIQLALFKRDQERGRERDGHGHVAGNEADDQIRLMVAGITDYAIFTLDSTGKVNSWNRGAERMNGYSAAQIMHQSFEVLFTPEDRDRNLPALELEEARRTGSADDTRWLVRRNGERYWAEGSLTTIVDSAGSITGFAKIARDATERKRMEQELLTTQNRLRVALLAARTGTWEWDIQRNEDVLDESLRAIFGLGPEQEIKTIEDFFALVHPDDRAKVMGAFERTRKDAVHLDTEFRVVRPDGTERWLIDKGEVQLDKEGHAVLMSGACVDITERKLAQEALRASEDRFRLFANNVRDYALFQLDTDGRIASWNAGAERLLGYQEQEILGQPSGIIFVPEDVVNREPEHEIEGATASGSSEDERWHLRKDGTRLWGSGVLTAIRDDSGALVGFAKVMRDDTERREANEKLTASLREKEVLLKEIHHRVKNNLQVVTSLLTLQADTLSGEGVRAAFEDACNRVRSIGEIHELLYRSPELARVDFKVYLDRLSKNLLSFHGIPTDRIQVTIDANGAELGIAEAIPCGLIVNELLTNSLKHAFPEGRPGRISLSLSCNGVCVLEVSDDGVGMPPGFAVEETNSLGLKLVAVLARQLRGKLDVESSGGTRVSVTFPRSNQARNGQSD